MAKKIECVYVEWDDSHANHGWTSFGALRNQTGQLICKSVGWIVHETKSHIHIVGHMCKEDTQYADGDGSMCIPKAVIKKRKKVTF